MDCLFKVVSLDDSTLRMKAEKIARNKVAFQIHFVTYLAVNVFLFGLWLWTSQVSGEYFPWFLFPLTGWGIGVLVHFFAVYRGEGYIVRLEEKEYLKLKGKNGN